MIVDSGKYYLYRHIRLDKNEPFYIGIGTKYISSLKYYKRSQHARGRNVFWRNVVNKTKYKIEIILESDNYEFIKQKEIEFIKLYGRRDLHEGPLVNLTNGGDGAYDYICTEQAKEKLRIINTGKSYSKEIKQKVALSSSLLWKKRKEQGEEFTKKFLENMVKARKVKVNQFTISGELLNTWDSLTSGAKSCNISSTGNIASCCKGKRPSAHGFIWRYLEESFDKYPYISRGHNINTNFGKIKR